jgi:hypothetical protein
MFQSTKANRQENAAAMLTQCHSSSYANTTAAAPTSFTAVGTGAVPTTASATTSAVTVPTAGAGKVAALSGGALAGLLGMAAFIL